jgi:PilZ domain
MGAFPVRLLRRDNRKSPRHELHFAAFIVVGDGPHRQPCVIHDVSEGGARLTVGPRAKIPDTFTLVFSRHCRVVRRIEADGQVGVRFLPGKV